MSASMAPLSGRIIDWKQQHRCSFGIHSLLAEGDHIDVLWPSLAARSLSSEEGTPLFGRLVRLHYVLTVWSHINEQVRAPLESTSSLPVHLNKDQVISLRPDSWR